jgi:hypothetical protein
MALFAEAISDLLEAVDGEEVTGFVAREESAVFWGFVMELFEVSVALQAMNSSALLTLATKKIPAMARYH